MSEQHLHLRLVALRLLDHIYVRLFLRSKALVLRVNLRERGIVEPQMHHAALVVDGPRRAVLNGLRHVIDVDVVAEHLARRPVALVYRRAREPDESRVRKRVVDDTRRRHHASRLDCSVLLAHHLLGLSEPVVSAVRFVRNHNHVAPTRKRLVRFLELLDRREEETVLLLLFQKPLQVRAALCLHCSLAKESRALEKLSVELPVEVVAVGQHENRRSVQFRRQEVRVENHRE